MTARERRIEMRRQLSVIASRYPHGARVLTLADEQAIYELRRAHTAAIAVERAANYCIREYGEMSDA